MAERATAGAGVLVARYFVVGVLNLAGATYLIRHLGVQAWASYSVALFVASFVDQQLGPRLLGSLIRARRLTPGLLQAAAFVSQACGAAVLAFLLLAAAPVGALTELPLAGAAFAAAGVCAYIYALRALPIAILERRLAYQWVAIGEVLDQVTFLVVGVAAVLLGAGLWGVLAALAVRGLPTLVLLRVRASVPLAGRRGPAVREISAFALPGSGIAICILLEGLVPLAVLGPDHPVELGFLMTAATVLSYAAVVVLVVHRLAFPVFSQLADDPQRLGALVSDVTLAATTLLIPSTAVFALAAPWWMPTLFGEQWSAAWPMAVGFAGSFILMSAINVMIGALMARDQTRDALHTWVVMLAAWTTGAIAFVVLDSARWILVGLVAARVLGFAVAWHRMVRGGIHPRHGRAFALSLAATGALYAGTAAIADNRYAIAVAATAVLIALDAVAARACWDWLLQTVRRTLAPYLRAQ